MKKFILILVITGSSFFAKAQWTTNSSGDIIPTSLSSKVGIGTASPNYKLELSTSINLDGLHLSHSNGAWVSIFSPSMIGGGYNGVTQAGDAGIIFGTNSGVNTVTNGFVIAPHRGGTSGLRMDQNGNIAIGTATPVASLTLNSAVARNAFRIYNNTTTNYLSIWQGDAGVVIDPIGTGLLFLGYDITTTVSMNGKLGIGTSTPLNGLNIFKSGDFDAGSIRYGHSSAYDGVSSFGYNTATGRDALKLSYFPHGSTSGQVDLMTLDVNGYVGIGTTSPDAKLAVSGQVHAQEVKVSVTVPGPDYVFEKDYKLTSLEEIKNYIDQNKHLPEVPSAKEMEKNGIQLGEMNMLLLKKIEELTLYVIEHQNEIKELRSELNNLKFK